MRYARVLGAVLLCSVCSACTLPIGEPVPAPPPPVPSTPNALTDSVARDVLAAVNRTRQSNGLSALREDAALNRAARGHAEELAARQVLDHNSIYPERRTMTMRIEATGATWMRAAENLANTSARAADVPAQTVQLWMRSEGHRRSMLEPAYTHTGVGVAADRRGVWYVTQLYVRPRGIR